MNRAQRRYNFRHSEVKRDIDWSEYNSHFKKEQPIVVVKNKMRVGYYRRQAMRQP